MPQWIRSSRTAQGVPLLTGDSDDVLLDAGIVFGVGPCDETLATSGFSHLVEHLALRGLEGDGINGSVRGTLTEFHLRGTRAEIGEFFEQLCPRLAAPPIEDLDVERRVLLAESDFRARERPDSLDMLPIQFGWRGLGLESLFETGLRSVTPEALTDWARRWFTSSNAICWSTGDPGAMRLDLPDGTRPAHSCRPRSTEPRWLSATTSSVGLSFVTELSPAGRLLNHLLARRAHEALRREQGLIYALRPDVIALPDCVYNVLWLPEVRARAESVTDTLLRLLEQLAEEGPSQDEIDEALAAGRRFGDDRENRVATLFGAAALGLIGQRPLEDVDPPSVEALASQAIAARDSLLVRVPAGTRVGHRLKKLETLSTTPIKGRTFAGGTRWGRVPIPIGPLQRLSVSAAGVSVRVLRTCHSMRFDACDGAIVQPGGEVWLLGNRGAWLRIKPNLYLRRDRVTAEVLRHLPESGVVQPEPEELRVKRAAAGRIELGTAETIAFARHLPPAEPILAFADLASANGRRVLVATDRRMVIADVSAGGLQDVSSVHHVDVRGTHLRGLAHDVLVLELERSELALPFTRASEIGAIEALIVAHSRRARETGDEAVEDDQNERPIKHLRYQDLLRPPTALAAVTVGLGAGVFDDLTRVPHGGAVGALLTIALLAAIGAARRRPGWDWRSAALCYSTTTPILTLVLVATLLERALG